MTPPASNPTPPSNASGTNAGEGKARDETDGAWPATLAKWLLPSLAALFAVVGYLSQSSQEALLGLRSDAADTKRYGGAAAAFVQEIFTSLMDSILLLAAGRPISLGGHGELLWSLLLLVVAVLVAPRLVARLPGTVQGQIGRWRPLAIRLLLVLILALKFLVLDAPLARLENMIVDIGGFRSDMNGTPVIGGFSARAGGDVQAAVEQRSTVLWQDMVCGRVGPESVGAPDTPVYAEICTKNRGDSRRALSGEFLAHLWMAALITALAVSLIRSKATASGVTLATLSLAYLLTVPYAHGKLLKSTYFDYGLVHVVNDISVGGAPARSQIFALILARTSTETHLLVAQPRACASGDPGRVVRMWSLAPSQLRSIENIYRQDVITWTTLNNQRCPPALPPL